MSNWCEVCSSRWNSQSTCPLSGAFLAHLRTSKEEAKKAAAGDEVWAVRWKTVWELGRLH